MTQQVQTSDIGIDPALDGAVTGKSKTVIQLGLDPSITPLAAKAAETCALFEQVEKELKGLKVLLRTYGNEKRSVWNGANPFGDVSTVKIPFAFDKDGVKEIRFVTVTVADAYTIEPNGLAKFKVAFPVEYKKLFVEKPTQVLRENGEAVLKMRLEAAGMSAAQIKELLDAVIETNVKVSTVKGFERKIESSEITDEVRTLLSLTVKQNESRISFGD